MFLADTVDFIITVFGFWALGYLDFFVISRACVSPNHCYL
uniref:Uncharacterized protein n=1 Tax=Anguilla anguilla TaxID=7936 RepID=A0A0E9PVJ4_ANGAN